MEAIKGKTERIYPHLQIFVYGILSQSLHTRSIKVNKNVFINAILCTTQDLLVNHKSKLLILY